MSGAWDAGTKSTLGKIPLLREKAGPRDKEGWPARLKEVPPPPPFPLPLPSFLPVPPVTRPARRCSSPPGGVSGGAGGARKGGGAVKCP